MSGSRQWNLRAALPEAVRSVRAFGWRRTGAVVVSRCRDILFDLRNGTDTIQPVEIDELDVETSVRAAGQRYQPAGTSSLRAILRGIPVEPSDVFVDFGCGKGRVLLLATAFPFRRIVGIEFAPALCAIALENIGTYGLRHPNAVVPEVVQADARNFTLADEETVFFFFHPFDAQVLAAVIANIEASLQRKPRRAFLIYYLPVHRGVIDASQSFRLMTARVVNGYDALIYIHQPEGAR